MAARIAENGGEGVEALVQELFFKFLADGSPSRRTNVGDRVSSRPKQYLQPAREADLRGSGGVSSSNPKGTHRVATDHHCSLCYRTDRLIRSVVSSISSLPMRYFSVFSDPTLQLLLN